MYSFRSNGEFSFEKDAYNRYGCAIYTFDPTSTDLKGGNSSVNLHFYKIGISNIDT